MTRAKVKSPLSKLTDANRKLRKQIENKREIIQELVRCLNYSVCTACHEFFGKSCCVSYRHVEARAAISKARKR